ncbi:MAG: BtrH N-terminal domain-containing protein [Haloarculaceae archaeon]
MPRLSLAHRPGNHCGSTSLRDLADYYGWGFDEAACFGLGSGLGFSFMRVSDSPQRLFFGRPSWLEWAFFEHVGVDHEIHEGQAFPDALDDVVTTVDAGAPVMIFTDLYYLDYYESSTHFSPHSLLVVGYDEDHVHLADSEFEAVQELPLDRLAEAMTSDHVTPLQCRYLTVEDPSLGADFETGARVAIRETATAMLDPAAGRGGGDADFGEQGVPAIRAFAADLPTWNDLDDPRWTARFAYPNVERRGTGGGAFRKMYADFLDQAVEAVPIPADAPVRMHDIAAAWTDLGRVLYEASETDDAAERESHFAAASERASDLADREAALYEDLRAAV